MGTCYSSNDPKKIKAHPYNRPKRSTGCGVCCNSGKDDISLIRPQNIIENEPNVHSSYTINHKNGQINEHINMLISNYQSPIPIKKINFIQLYNIFMNFTYDFTNCNFIVCDTRTGEEGKSQLFLKKFNRINYTSKQIASMQPERINKFKNYLKNKNIIFILDESTFETLEQFITIFSINEFDIKNIYVLSEAIKKYEERQINNTYIENLNLFIDEDALYPYTPKILINSADIKSSNINYENADSHNALAFVVTYPHIVNDKNKLNMNKLGIDNICDENLTDEDIYLKFFSKFKIEYILNFNLEEKNDNEVNENVNNNLGNITYSNAKRKKIGGEEHKTMINQINVSIPQNDFNFDNFYNLNQSSFDKIINDFKAQIINNHCIIFEFDESIEEIIKMKFLYTIINRITGLGFENIQSYLKKNFFNLTQENIWPIKDEMQNFLK